MSSICLIQRTFEAASSRDCCFTLDQACVCEPNIEVLHLICTALLGQISQQFRLAFESNSVLLNKRLMANNKRLYKKKRTALIHNNGFSDRFNLHTKTPRVVRCATNGNRLIQGRKKRYISILHQT